MSNSDFNTIQSIYKSLKHFKSFLRMPEVIGRTSIIADTFEIFCARLKELISIIENVQSNEMRYIAMSLTLYYDNLDISLQHSSDWSYAMISLEHQMNIHASHRFNELIFLIYLKSSILLANSNADKRWQLTVKEMFRHLKTKSKEVILFDSDGIFSETLKPMNSQEQSDMIRELSRQLADKMEEMENIFEEPPMVWCKKLHDLVPKWLKKKQFKKTAHYLLTAIQILDTDESITTIRSSIVTLWIHFVFRISDVENKQSEDCFQNSLSDDENLQLYVNSLFDSSQAKNLISFSIEIIQKLLKHCNFLSHPLSYITHVYQLSDLLNISMRLSQEDSYFNQLKRFHYFEQMLQWLRAHHPHVFEATSVNILIELNEIINNVYETNFNRMLCQIKTISDSQRNDLRQQLRTKVDQLNKFNSFVLHKESNK